MSYPRQDRNRWLLFAVAPSVALVGVVVWLQRLPPHPAVPIIQGILACVILLLGGAGFFGTLHSHGEAWGADRLRAGKDLLARWSVPVDVWHQFCTTEPSFAGKERDLSEGPVEVLIGKRGFVLGEEFHSLRGIDGCRSFSLTEGRRPFLTAWYYVDSDAGPSEWCVHIPVAPGTEPEARRVQEHFRNRLS